MNAGKLEEIAPYFLCIAPHPGLHYLVLAAGLKA
jgi:hypothetical protein